MRISVASMGDPELVGTWSGIPSNIIYALKKRGHTVYPITLTFPKEPWYFNWLRRLHHRLYKRWFLSSVEAVYLKQVGFELDEQVEAISPDVVLVIHGDFLANTTFKQPACLIHDTTFETLVDYYDSFSNLADRSIKAGNDMYQRALNRANAAIFSSDWASNSAINFYKADKSKVFTVPFGANLKKIPGSDNVNSWILERSRAEVCNMLFLGAEWHRKGGEDTLRIVAELNRLGVKSQLTIVGCSPEIPDQYKPFVNQVGFLRKDIEEEAEKLESILINANVLILPSIAECYGCVYCEANAYGLPVLGRDTGGVSEIIEDGNNGLLMKPGELPEDFAIRWASVWSNKNSYKSFSDNARREFKDRLNYEVFVTRLEEILFGVIKKDKRNVREINIS